MQPEGVRLLADRLVATADLADALALDIGRAVFDSELASTTQSPSLQCFAASDRQSSSAMLT